jgi:hypothetical protein
MKQQQHAFAIAHIFSNPAHLDEFKKAIGTQCSGVRNKYREHVSAISMLSNDSSLIIPLL